MTRCRIQPAVRQATSNIFAADSSATWTRLATARSNAWMCLAAGWAQGTLSTLGSWRGHHPSRIVAAMKVFTFITSRCRHLRSIGTIRACRIRRPPGTSASHGRGDEPGSPPSPPRGSACRPERQHHTARARSGRIGAAVAWASLPWSRPATTTAKACADVFQFRAPLDLLASPLSLRRGPGRPPSAPSRARGEAGGPPFPSQAGEARCDARSVCSVSAVLFHHSLLHGKAQARSKHPGHPPVSGWLSPRWGSLCPASAPMGAGGGRERRSTDHPGGLRGLAWNARRRRDRAWSGS
jgi:hypothetical protein